MNTIRDGEWISVWVLHKKPYELVVFYKMIRH